MPEADKLLNSSGVLKSTGSWMVGLAENLIKKENVRLFIATVSRRVNKMTKLQGEKIVYYILPLKHYTECWDIVNREVNPNVIHLHGTEYPWGSSYVEQCGSNHVVLSIQGLLSAIYPHYCSGLTTTEIIKNLTLRTILRGGVFKGARNYKKQSDREIQLIRKINHIIGRTTWDKSHIWAINPCANYHHCNEILRNDFYDGSLWDYNKCSKHTIFLSQASYPVKGLHQLLKAMPMVLQHFPDAHIRVAGLNVSDRSKGLMGLLKYSNYGRIVHTLIKKNMLEEHISFTGPLDAERMKSEYLKSNVYICPSSIENSPNSLGEAQILGVPCVAAYVGGIPDMIPNMACGTMYRFEEIEMLAYAICDVFNQTDFPNQSLMVDVAQNRHSPETIIETMMDIYKTVSEQC